MLPRAHHAQRGGLRAEERPLEVRIDDPVPQRLADLQRGARLLDAGVIDQNVEPRVGLEDSIERRLDALRHGDVGHAVSGLVSRPDERRLQRGERTRVAAEQDDGGPGLRESRGERATDAARGTGHHRDLAGEREHHARRLFSRHRRASPRTR